MADTKKYICTKNIRHGEEGGELYNYLAGRSYDLTDAELEMGKVSGCMEPVQEEKPADPPPAELKFKLAEKASAEDESIRVDGDITALELPALLVIGSGESEETVLTAREIEAGLISEDRIPIEAALEKDHNKGIVVRVTDPDGEE